MGRRHKKHHRASGKTARDQSATSLHGEPVVNSGHGRQGLGEGTGRWLFRGSNLYIVSGILTLFAVVVSVLGFRTYMDNEQDSYVDNLYGSVEATPLLTSGVDDNDNPTDELETISLDMERFYVYTSWKNLPLGYHSYRIKLTDGAGNVAWDSGFEMYAAHANKPSWSWYYFKEGIDVPGTWGCEVYLEGYRMYEMTFEVTPPVLN